MERWALSGIEAKVGSKIYKNLARLRALAAPRVQAACFSTVWNRWCSPRRYQDRGSPKNVCLLTCGGQAEDSIEHYARCSAIREVADRFLRLGHTFKIDMEHFMLSAESLRDDPESLVCVAVLVYAAYTSTNKVRMTGAIPLSHKEACELLISSMVLWKQHCLSQLRYGKSLGSGC